MKLRKKEKKMDKTIGGYTKTSYSTTPTFAWVNWVDTLIKAGMLTHEDIPVFSFAPLDEIRKDLMEAGYPAKEIDSTIAGLSELPEYASSNRDQTSKNQN